MICDHLTAFWWLNCESSLQAGWNEALVATDKECFFSKKWINAAWKRKIRAKGSPSGGTSSRLRPMEMLSPHWAAGHVVKERTAISSSLWIKSGWVGFYLYIPKPGKMDSPQPAPARPPVVKELKVACCKYTAFTRLRRRLTSVQHCYAAQWILRLGPAVTSFFEDNDSSIQYSSILSFYLEIVFRIKIKSQMY